MESSILYENEAQTVFLIDIPRSIEEAQGFPSPFPIRLLSTPPRATPYPSTEPKNAEARAKLPEPSMDDLFTQTYTRLFIESVKAEYNGPWCLPRVTEDETFMRRFDTPGNGDEMVWFSNRQARRAKKSSEVSNPWDIRPNVDHDIQVLDPKKGILYQNPGYQVVALGSEQMHLPPHSTAISGFIEATSDFIHSAPKFEIMIMDPPWPNRSALRKGWYDTAWSSHEILQTFEKIPIQAKLAKDGIIGVWVTNKLGFREMVVGEGGIFESRGIDFIEEWIWVKMTSEGEPVTPLDGVWRKPYEILLIGRHTEMPRHPRQDFSRRVILGVPDLHSRKPNLKVVFEKVFGLKKDRYEGLEVFARNMTTGWWAWGNECLKFQGYEFWSPSEEGAVKKAVEESRCPVQ